MTTRAVHAAMLLNAVALVALGLSGTVPAAAAAMVTVALSIGVWSVLGQSLRQELTPSRLMGRVVTAFRMVGIGGGPVGAVIGGLLARAYGLTAAFVAGAALLVVVGVAAMPVITERVLREARNRAAPAGAAAVP